MKFHILTFHLVALTGCSKPEANKAYELNHPQAVITTAARETVTDDFFEIHLKSEGTHSGINDESSDNVYSTDYTLKGIRVKYEVLSSKLIKNDGVTEVNGNRYTDLIPADIYLFQIKLPNKTWETETVVYTGKKTLVFTHPQIKISIENSDPAVTGND